ncbi:hypothetical protein PAXRUDRAFT_829408 [Paxillus rubicundulus Ve08.2h10]|uniref:SUZ domain-containing protein n=1 Tax=Paxillus rubicundulus Ve08.2h10 TaxID=930991 RepID=A0A0D0DMV2_9AGAM|nr:hypothetical protein PAXRUDRAFT_829408 [Paxillus rubicundulus Ve08.2h10]
MLTQTYATLHHPPVQAGLKPQPPVVRDDWDEDDDGEEEQDNAKIWEAANNKTPMPELIISPASTGQTILPSPPAAFQPTLRILKRPSPSQSTSATSTSLSLAQTRSTFAEREAQYQEARNRIFGERNAGRGIPLGQECLVDERATLGGDMGKKSASRSAVTVVRDPLGPSFESSIQDKGQPAKGFGDRRSRGKQVNEVLSGRSLASDLRT